MIALELVLAREGEHLSAASAEAQAKTLVRKIASSKAIKLTVRAGAFAHDAGRATQVLTFVRDKFQDIQVVRRQFEEYAALVQVAARQSEWDLDDYSVYGDDGERVKPPFASVMGQFKGGRLLTKTEVDLPPLTDAVYDK